MSRNETSADFKENKAAKEAKRKELERLEKERQDAWTKYSDYYDQYNNTYGGMGDKLLDSSSTSDINKAYEDLQKKVANLSTTQQTIDESNAARLSQGAAVQTSKSQEIAAKNTGLNTSRAGNLATNNTYENVYRNLNQTLGNQSAMTQADWLEKMGYANGLQQGAQNLEKGANLNVAGAAFQGISDENEKEAPINNDSDLPKADAFDAIAQLEQELGESADFFDDDNIIKQLAQLETVSYQYKHPEKEGEDADIHRAGFTAQSLQKIPLFKKCVIEDDGILKIDLDRLEAVITEKVLPALKQKIGETD